MGGGFGGGGGGGAGGGGFGSLGPGGGAAAAPDGDVPEGATTCPVALAGLAEVPRLSQAVVVEVAELGVCGFASGALERPFRHGQVRHPSPLHHRPAPPAAAPVLCLCRRRRQLLLRIPARVRVTEAITSITCLLVLQSRKYFKKRE